MWREAAVSKGKMRTDDEAPGDDRGNSLGIIIYNLLCLVLLVLFLLDNVEKDKLAQKFKFSVGFHHLVAMCLGARNFQIQAYHLQNGGNSYTSWHRCVASVN